MIATLPWQMPDKKARVTLNVAVCLLITVVIIFCLSWEVLPYTLFKTTESQIPITIPSLSVDISLQSTPYDQTKLAFLVETRPLPHLPFLFSHMASIMPPEWTFKFMGSTASITYLRSSPAIRHIESISKLSLIPIPANYSVADRESVSQMFTDPHLYNTILAPAEHLLVFQPDAIFCSNSPRTINDFLAYDWIGAPWSATAQYGGNGGLSLRRVSRILAVLEKQRRKANDGALEDLWLSEQLHSLKGAHMANATVSKSFSVESVWDDQPLGYHVGWMGVHHGQIWDNEEQVKHIIEYCPEVKMILGMRLGGDKPIGVD